MDSGKPVVSIFSVDQARRLSGLSARQLSYWDQTDFFSPTHRASAGERFGRVYVFQDLVGLRLIAIMRKRVPLQELRRVGEWLSTTRGSWTGTKFWIRGKRVYWDDQEGHRIGTKSAVGHVIGTRTVGQFEMPVEMDEVTEQMRKAVERLRVRAPKQYGRVETRRYTVGNAPLLAGTRIPTRTIWRLSRGGYDEPAIRSEYPQLTKRDVSAALKWESQRRSA